MSTTIFDLAADYARLEELLLEGEGEVTAEMQGELERLGLAERHKVDAIGSLRADLRGRAEMCRTEMHRLLAKERVYLHAVERLGALVEWYLRERGLRKLEGNRWTVAIQKNGGELPIVLKVPVEELPATLQRVLRSENKDTIREALTNKVEGIEKYAAFGERGEGIRFR